MGEHKTARQTQTELEMKAGALSILRGRVDMLVHELGKKYKIPENMDLSYRLDKWDHMVTFKVIEGTQTILCIRENVEGFPSQQIKTSLALLGR